MCSILTRVRSIKLLHSPLWRPRSSHHRHPPSQDITNWDNSISKQRSPPLEHSISETKIIHFGLFHLKMLSSHYHMLSSDGNWSTLPQGRSWTKNIISILFLHIVITHKSLQRVCHTFSQKLLSISNTDQFPVSSLTVQIWSVTSFVKYLYPNFGSTSRYYTGKLALLSIYTFASLQRWKNAHMCITHEDEKPKTNKYCIFVISVSALVITK